MRYNIVWQWQGCVWHDDPRASVNYQACARFLLADTTNLKPRRVIRDPQRRLYYGEVSRSNISPQSNFDICLLSSLEASSSEKALFDPIVQLA